MIQILTNNGVDNTNIDGARFNNFTAGNRAGIISKVLNEGTLYLASSNAVTLDTCELIMCGHLVVIDEPITKTVASKPLTATRYAIVAQITMLAETLSFELIVTTPSSSYKTDNINNGDGVYELEIGRFTHLTDGTITDLVRTADVITGGSGGFDLGTVKTNTLETTEAEVDIEKDPETKKYNFIFGIPRIGEKGEIGYGYKGNTVTISNYTESQWTELGTIGHTEEFAGTEVGSLRVGDLFFVAGLATDTGNYHKLTYSNTASEGILKGTCKVHEISQKGDPQNAIVYDKEQSLTEAQRLQALANAGAVGYVAQSLTNEEKYQACKNIGTYPISKGYLYLATESTSPASLFGGTWEELPSDRVLQIIASTASREEPTIDAGLPNIKAYIEPITTDRAEQSAFYTEGAFLNTSDYDKSGSNNSGGSRIKINFQADLGECKTDGTYKTDTDYKVYGKSDTVQPNATKIYGWAFVSW